MRRLAMSALLAITLAPGAQARGGGGHGGGGGHASGGHSFGGGHATAEGSAAGEARGSSFSWHWPWAHAAHPSTPACNQASDKPRAKDDSCHD
jgi:hypothetical protein